MMNKKNSRNFFLSHHHHHTSAFHLEREREFIEGKLKRIKANKTIYIKTK